MPFPEEHKIDEDYEGYESYGDFLARTGLEDTEQHYEMFISGGYIEVEDEW